MSSTQPQIVTAGATRCAAGDRLHGTTRTRRRSPACHSSWRYRDWVPEPIRPAVWPGALHDRVRQPAPGALGGVQIAAIFRRGMYRCCVLLISGTGQDQRMEWVSRHVAANGADSRARPAGGETVPAALAQGGCGSLGRALCHGQCPEPEVRDQACSSAGPAAPPLGPLATFAPNFRSRTRAAGDEMLEGYDLSDRPGADAGLPVRSRPDWVESATASSASLRNASSSCARAKRMAAACAAAAPAAQRRRVARQ